MIDAHQYEDLIVSPVLRDLGMWSEAAQELMMDTAMVESRLTFKRQIIAGGGYGPACGFMQVEPKTAMDIVDRYLGLRAELRARTQKAVFPLLSSVLWDGSDLDGLARKLINDDAFGVAVARLRYWMDPQPLPEADDLEGLGAYWVRVYNAGGAGTVAKFVMAARQLREHR